MAKRKRIQRQSPEAIAWALMDHAVECAAHFVEKHTSEGDTDKTIEAAEALGRNSMFRSTYEDREAGAVVKSARRKGNVSQRQHAEARRASWLSEAAEMRTLNPRRSINDIATAISIRDGIRQRTIYDFLLKNLLK